jgi:hypothetical protein
MEFDGGECELLSNLRVFYFTGLVEREAHDTLGHVRTRSDGASATKRLELDVRDNTVVVDTNLQLHNVAASVPMTKVRDNSFFSWSARFRPRDVGETRTQVHRRAQYQRLCHLWGGSPPTCGEAKREIIR